MDQLDKELDLAAMDASGLRRLSRPLQGLGWYAQEVYDRLFEDTKGRSCLKMDRDLYLDLTPVPPVHHFIESPDYNFKDSDEGVLDAFVTLADATDEQILAFAQRYGALEMCEHGFPPLWHVPSWGRKGPNLAYKEWCLDSNIVLQPTELYRQHAREARALLRVASFLHQKKRVPDEDWQILKESRTADLPDDHEVRRRIEHVVAKWVFWGNVEPALLWEDGRTDIVLQGAGLWGALARQLAFAIARIDRWALCHGCGKVYVPKRKPATGRRTWCLEKSCKIASRRRAQRDYRAR